MDDEYEYIDSPVIQPQQQEKESSGILGTIGRYGARAAKNIVSLAAGFAGSTAKSMLEGASGPNLVQELTGQKQKHVTEYEKTPLGDFLKTTEQHKQALEELAPETLKPQNAIEQFADNVTEDAILLATGNPKQIAQRGLKRAIPFFKNVGKALFSNVAGKGIEEVTGSEKAGNMTRAGSLFAWSLFNKPKAEQQISELYDEAASKLPQGAKVNATSLTAELDALEHSITKGRPLTSSSGKESFVLNQIKKIRDLISNGEASVEQIVAQKKSLHDDLAILYKEVPNKAAQKTVKNQAKQLSHFLNKSLADYGKQNSEWYKLQKSADEAFGTMARSNLVSKWIENHVTGGPITEGLLALFGLSAKAGTVGLGKLVAGTSGALATGAATTATLAGYQGSKLLYRVYNSPTLRKIYGNALSEAAKENALLFNKYLKQLDSGLQKEESKDEYEYVDQ